MNEKTEAFQNLDVTAWETALPLVNYLRTQRPHAGGGAPFAVLEETFLYLSLLMLDAVKDDGSIAFKMGNFLVDYAKIINPAFASGERQC